MPVFDAYGPAHWGALATTAAAAAALIAGGDRPAARNAGRALGALILAAQVFEPFHHHAHGVLRLDTSLPLEVCDMAGFACTWALWTRGRFAFEIAWFWGLAGTLQGLLTPTVAHGWPHLEFVRFFALHGGIVAGALYLAFGARMRPRPRAPRRLFVLTLAYAAVIGVVDAALGANYMYLRRKPEGSVLEWFGPWPVYLLAGAVIAALLFRLLDLPFRRLPSEAPRGTARP